MSLIRSPAAATPHLRQGADAAAIAGAASVGWLALGALALGAMALAQPRLPAAADGEAG